MLREARPARQIVRELGTENLRSATVVSELPREQRLDFCFNLLGSIHNQDVTLALENLSREESLDLIKSRLMAKRNVHWVALNRYVNAKEVSKADLYDVLGLGENKLVGVEPRQAIAEALYDGEDVIQTDKPISPKVISDAIEMFPEQLGAAGSHILVTFAGAQLPPDVRKFIEAAVDRLSKEKLVDKSELADFVKGTIASKLIVAKHPEAGKSALMKIVCDRSDMVSAAAYRNLKERDLVDDAVRDSMVNARYWWVRRQLIDDPEAKRPTLEALADRYKQILVREFKQKVKRGLLRGLSDPKVVPKASEFTSLDIVLLIMIQLGLADYSIEVIGEAIDLATRLHPHFKQAADHFFDQVATEAEARDDYGHMRG
jgi:hypothetical protein